MTIGMKAQHEKNSVKLAMHPCFNAGSRHKYARIHLPVAPSCNVQCKFCDRKFSCVNESRPGVTASLQSPSQAIDYLDMKMATIPSIRVVGIAGPGDPFSEPELTLETLRLVRAHHREIMLCTSSNGLDIVPYIGELAKLHVSHVTITVNAVDPCIGAEIYEWVKGPKGILKGRSGASLLWERQSSAIKMLHRAGILIKINTVCIPGINSFHAETIAKTVASLGASLHNIIPMIPVSGTAFATISEPSPEKINAIRLRTGRFLPQMKHCSRCRADAVGLLGDDYFSHNNNHVNGTVTGLADNKQVYDSRNKKNDNNDGEELQFTVNQDVSIEIIRNKIKKGRPLIAVSGSECLSMNSNLGKSDHLKIYSILENKPFLMDTRVLPQRRGTCGHDYWNVVAEIIKDCSVLLTKGIAPFPRTFFAEKGIDVIITETDIFDNQALYDSAICKIQCSCSQATFDENEKSGCGGCS
jgi:nitrogen fixation protein NifB